VSTDQEPPGQAFTVNAPWSAGLQVGYHNVQINVYAPGTWADSSAQRPLADASGVIASPYRGLGVFEERDEEFFFGRETAVTQVMQRMSQCAAGPGLLVVSGVSGAGKSSLLRAGMLPQMRRSGLAAAPGSASWPCLLFTPGRAPIGERAVRTAALAGIDAAAVQRSVARDPGAFALTARQAALARQQEAGGNRQQEPGGNGRLLLVIDQFEQLFTQCPDEEQRRAYVAALHAAAAPGTAPAALIVLGVRADFEARCADYPQLVEAIQDRYLLTAMTRRELRLAITGPARKAGSRVDAELVDDLLREVGTRLPAGPGPSQVVGAGVLPLLSHALDQAWRNRTGDTLTLADYDRSGGMETAVAASADRAYEGLTARQQATARQVFLQLTAAGGEGADMAIRADRAELSAGENTDDVQAVLAAFAAERLLTLSADSVEISHEVLLTAWPLLRDTWLAQTRADRLVRTKLRDTAGEWARHDQDPSYLYAGSLLEAAARVAADPIRHATLSPPEREFLRHSERARRRRTRRLRAFVAILAVLVMGLAVVAFAAIRAGQQTASERDAADGALVVADAGELAADSQALGDADPVLARLEALAAWRSDPSSAQARYAVWSAALLPGIAVLGGQAGQVDALAFSPDGTTLATTTGTNSPASGTQLWDVATHQPLGRPLSVPGSGEIVSLAFSPDGKILAAGTARGDTQLWDVATRELMASLPGGTGLEVASLAFSPDGRLLAIGTTYAQESDPAGSARLWDVGTRRPLGPPLVTSSAGICSVVFSPGGQTLAVGVNDGSTHLWDVAGRQPLGHPLPDSVSGLASDPLAFSPDGKTLATAAGTGAKLWDVATGRLIRTLGDSEGAYSVAFDPDGQTLAVGSQFGPAQLWDVATQQQVGPPLTGSGNAIYAMTFSPDGQILATGTSVGTELWSVTTAIGNPSAMLPDSGGVLSVSFSRSGILATGPYDDGTVRRWNVATQRQVGTTVTTHADIFGGNLTSSPDGRTLALGTATGTLLWTATASHPADITLRSTTAISSVAFSPDGKFLAASNRDGTELWQVATRKQVGVIHNGSSGLSVFSPDGKMLATEDGGTIRLWSVATRRPVGGSLTSDSQVDSLAFSPEGGPVLAAGTGAGTEVWNLASRRPAGVLLPSSSEVRSVAFSPDGTVLAAGTATGVQLWDVATGQQLGPSLTATPDQSPESASEAPGGLQTVRPSDSATEVSSVAFSPDGKTLAVGLANGPTQLWNVAFLLPSDTGSYICASTGQTLTRTQWTQYAKSLPYQDVCS
jgi:WD40 repeat protein